MRLIDADELLNKTANLEAVALEQVAKYNPSEDPGGWLIWSAIHAERSAFKYNLMDAPTIDAEPIRHGHWIHEYPNVGHLTHFYLCSVCRAEWNAIDNDMERFDYCPNCGAKMDEEEQT